MNELGEYICAQRIKADLSKRQLAILSGISDSEIHKIEGGKRKNPSAAHLKSIASVLGVSCEDIFKAAGYLENIKSSTASMIVGLDKLNSSELHIVQAFVDFLISRKERN